MPIVIEPTAGHVTPSDLEARFPDATALEPRRPEVAATIAAADEPVAFLCTNTAWREEYLDALSAGDWVLTTTAGYDGYPIDAFEERGIVLTNCPGISGETVAEHALGLAIAFNRQLTAYYRRQQNREWGERRDDLTDFVDERCCVVGLGHVGEAVARRAAAFGMDVRGVKRTVDGYDGAADEVYPPEDLRSALTDAALLVLAVPLTDETRGLVGEAELAAVDDDAVVVNVARGPVLETEALLAALDAGEVRGAALDVFDEEPLPPGSPLWEREDVFVTPHCAGTSDKYGERALEIVAAQYRRWRDGEELRHRVV